MENPPLLEEESNKYHKPKGLSIFASIFSLLICISIFYIFNLSPYTLFNNHIFLFIMSNTLILIIAADYEAFCSSKRKQDLYEEYLKHSQTRKHVSSYVPKEEEVEKTCIINPKLVLENKEAITQRIEVPERVLEIVTPQNEPKKPSGYSNEKKPLLPLEVDHSSYKASEKRLIKECPDTRDSLMEYKANRCEGKPIPETIYRRSKSDRHDKVKRVVNDESMNNVMRRSETMKLEAKVNENDFSTMTNEELNRRVEEFIQKFNRRIRLQATRNVSQI